MIGRRGSLKRRGTGIATPSSRRRVDGVEDDAKIEHERAVKFPHKRQPALAAFLAGGIFTLSPLARLDFVDGYAVGVRPGDGGGGARPRGLVQVPELLDEVVVLSD